MLPKKLTSRAQDFCWNATKTVTDVEMTNLFSKYENIEDLQNLRGSQQTNKVNH
jgi:hypothetical protein